MRPETSSRSFLIKTSRHKNGKHFINPFREVHNEKKTSNNKMNEISKKWSLFTYKAKLEEHEAGSKWKRVDSMGAKSFT